MPSSSCTRTRREALGRERLDRMGLPSTVVPSPGISEDIAILLAHEKGAELIVAVGTHFNLTAFLERNRAQVCRPRSSRLKVGEKLVDARGVSRLFRGRVGLWPLVAFTAAGLAAIVAVVATSSELQEFISLLASRVGEILGLE